MKIKNINLGITLIELIVVMSIIIIIVGIGIVEFGRVDDKAVRERALIAAKGLATGLKLYYQDNKENYPLTNLISSLAPYVNITTLRTQFEPSPPAGAAGGVNAAPLQGIQIYYKNNAPTWQGDEVCIYGAVKTLTYSTSGGSRYFIMYCVDTFDSNAWSKGVDQPTCYWEKPTGTPIHGWQACTKGL